VSEPSRLRAISGRATLSSKCLHAADRDRRVVADHLRGDLEHDLRNDGVDLPRLIDEPFWSRAGRAPPIPARGPEPISAKILRDLRGANGDDLERARQLDEGITVPHALRRDLRGVLIASPVSRSAARARVAANSGCVLSPVPVAVPPSGIWATCGSAASTRLRPSRIWRVAGELLARVTVRRPWVGAAGLGRSR